DDRRELELGAAARRTSRAALAAYADGIVDVLANVRTALRPGAPVVIVVNDRRVLYPEILDRAGLRLDERLRRHVNRRTGRRAGGREEPLVEVTPEAAAAVVGPHADEVDVGLLGVRLGEEAAQEADHLAVLFRDEARVAEVLEEEAREHRPHRPAAPPLVDM